MGVGAGLWPSMGVAGCRSNMGVGVMVLYGHWGAGLWPYMGIGGGAVALHGHRGRGGGLIWALGVGRWWPYMGVAGCRSNTGVGVMALYGHWAGLWPYMGMRAGCRSDMGMGAGQWPYMGIGVVALYGGGNGLIWAWGRGNDPIRVGHWPYMGMGAGRWLFMVMGAGHLVQMGVRGWIMTLYGMMRL